MRASGQDNVIGLVSVYIYRIAGIFSGYKLSRIKGEASFRDSYFHDHSNLQRTSPVQYCCLNLILED